MSDEMTANVDEIIERSVALRRALHRRPEPTWSEVETTAMIRETLTEAGVSWRECTPTGTIATLAPNATGNHIALRADIDALAINEATNLEWKSEREGLMHACGHDGHTATLMAAAWWFKQHEDALPGPVSLLFQPAEEGGHGALRMIEAGALDGIGEIYGWHNWPAIEFGKAVCPGGPVMGANATFSIVLNGSGGHASQPEICRDPVLAAAAITLAVQQIVSRRIAPQHAAVVSVTSIDAASNYTAIPDSATLKGTLRYSDQEVGTQVESVFEQVVSDSARAYGVNSTLMIEPCYRPTINHATQAETMRAALSAELGSDWRDANLPLPIMASEDFSYYLKEIPGAFALIGANDGPAHEAPCHSRAYDFNDALIPLVLKMFSRLCGAPLPL